MDRTGPWRLNRRRAPSSPSDPNGCAFAAALVLALVLALFSVALFVAFRLRAALLVLWLVGGHRGMKLARANPYDECGSVDYYRYCTYIARSGARSDRWKQGQLIVKLILYSPSVRGRTLFSTWKSRMLGSCPDCLDLRLHSPQTVSHDNLKILSHCMTGFGLSTLHPVLQLLFVL
jgi:hypothetical protein